MNIFRSVFQNHYSQKLIDLLTVVSLYHYQVLQLVKAVEESHPSLPSKKDLDAIRHLPDGQIHDAYVPLVFNGMIGLFHTNNESTEIWEPSSKCLAVLLEKHTGAVWNDFVHYLDQYQQALHNDNVNENCSSSLKHTGKVFRCFR